MYIVYARFEKPPPSDAELAAELARQTGFRSVYVEILGTGEKDVYGFSVHLHRLLMAYLCKVLRDFGGVRVDRDGAPQPWDLPDYTERPWREWSLWRRLRILWSGMR